MASGTGRSEGDTEVGLCILRVGVGTAWAWGSSSGAESWNEGWVVIIVGNEGFFPAICARICWVVRMGGDGAKSRGTKISQRCPPTQEFKMGLCKTREPRFAKIERGD